jgi:hypothetical protein
LNLDTFQVRAAVVHDVPRGGDEHEPLVLTDGPITLDGQLRAYFRRKIIKSLSMRGVDAVVQPDESPCVRDAITQVLADHGALVEASKEVATHLNAAQTGRNPAGLLAVVLGEIDSSDCVSILKLEREQGLRFDIATRTDGRHIVDLELLRQLTLTDKTKVFKTSLLQVATPHEPATMFGRVSDDQRGAADGTSVASFFLTTFLGCTLRTSPEKATLDFVRAADSYFNEMVGSPERRGRYQVALLSRMQDQVMDMRPRDFAQEHLDHPDRAPFLDRVRDGGLDPNVAFTKDTSLVKVSGFKMTFDSGMVLVGRREDLEQRIAIRPEGSEQPGIEVNDTVKRLGGR